MLTAAGDPLDVRRPYVSAASSVELHRIGAASLSLRFRRWHVVTIPLEPAAVSRVGGTEERRGRFLPGEVGIYPAGPGEIITWPEGICAVHVHLHPARWSGPGASPGLPYLFRTRDHSLATLGQELADILGPRPDLSGARSLLDVLGAHLRDRYAVDSPAVVPRLGRADLEEILSFVDTHAGTSLRVTDLAERAGLSRFHFTRVFRHTMGLGPAEYLQRRRVEMARHMLGVEGRSLASIAQACGFADQSHMTRAFRIFADTTPRRLRRQSRSPLGPA